MLTIFTIPKAFKGEFYDIQLNAIESWTLLNPKPEIILVGNDEGIAETAKEFNVKHISMVKENEFGVPLFDDVFKSVQAQAQNEIIAYVGADIILMDSFMKAVVMIKMKEFLMTGQRRDSITGKLYGVSGLDYWIVPLNLELDCPSFPIGQFGFDNWLIYRSKELKIPIIDATEIINAFHQNHTISSNRKTKLDLTKMATLRDADWILTWQGLKRPSFLKSIFPKLTLFYPWRLLLGLKRKIQKELG